MACSAPLSPIWESLDGGRVVSHLILSTTQWAPPGPGIRHQDRLQGRRWRPSSAGWDPMECRGSNPGQVCAQ